MFSFLLGRVLLVENASSEKGKLGYHFDSGSGEIGRRSVVARVLAVFGFSCFLVLNVDFGS